ncbi:hypothetical protein BH23GEM8_BH23GEM8_01970 [soil metagenome]
MARIGCHCSHEQFAPERLLELVTSSVLAELRTPEQFDSAAKPVSRDFVTEQVRVSSHPEPHTEWLLEDLSLGFDEIYLPMCTETNRSGSSRYSENRTSGDPRRIGSVSHARHAGRAAGQASHGEEETNGR